MTPDGPGGLALATVKEAQAATLTSADCCEIDSAATWTAGDSRSFQVDPGKQGVVAVHVLTSHCEDNGPGGYVVFDTITVHYSVLGFPHTQAVGVGPYWFQSPATCPRSGAAPPA